MRWTIRIDEAEGKERYDVTSQTMTQGISWLSSLLLSSSSSSLGPLLVALPSLSLCFSLLLCGLFVLCQMACRREVRLSWERILGLPKIDAWRELGRRSFLSNTSVSQMSNFGTRLNPFKQSAMSVDRRLR